MKTKIDGVNCELHCNWRDNPNIFKITRADLIKACDGLIELHVNWAELEYSYQWKNARVVSFAQQLSICGDNDYLFTYDGVALAFTNDNKYSNNLELGLKWTEDKRSYKFFNAEVIEYGCRLYWRSYDGYGAAEAVSLL